MDEGVKQYFRVKEKLNQLLNQEEIYWKQREKTFWLNEGDDNTKFFHACASARKKNNHLSFREDESGRQITNQEEMCHLVKNYFTSVYTNDNSSDLPQLEEADR